MEKLLIFGRSTKTSLPILVGGFGRRERNETSLSHPTSRSHALSKALARALNPSSGLDQARPKIFRPSRPGPFVAWSHCAEKSWVWITKGFRINLQTQRYAFLFSVLIFCLDVPLGDTNWSSYHTAEQKGKLHTRPFIWTLYVTCQLSWLFGKCFSCYSLILYWLFQECVAFLLSTTHNAIIENNTTTTTTCLSLLHCQPHKTTVQARATQSFAYMDQMPMGLSRPFRNSCTDTGAEL